MTCERADDKCEKCGVILLELALHADFEDVIACSSCVNPDASNIAEYYLYDDKSSK